MTNAPLDLLPPLPRAFVTELASYVPGEQPTEPGYIKLNTNEFPYAAPKGVKAAIVREAADSVRVYPNPASAPLRAALAARHGVTPQQVLVGNGSDEILRLLAHAFLGAGRKLAVVRPSYTLYDVLAAQFEAEVAVHPLDGGEILPDSLYQEPWDACFLPVPNPPLGTQFAEDALRALAALGRILVLDGAYVDFTTQAHEPIAWLPQYPNLIVTRTFSKSFGLAGMRVGYTVAHPAIIDWLDRLRDSYNINRISQSAALAALEASDYYKARCAEIIASRTLLTAQLSSRGYRVHASQGNFVFARHKHAQAIYEKLKERKILVRYFAHSGLEDGLRITIGTPEELTALVAALDQIECVLGC